MFSLLGTLAILAGVAAAAALLYQSVRAARSDDAAEHADLRPMSVALLA